MEVSGRAQTEGTLQKYLPSRRSQQIPTPHHLRDPHRSIVHHAGQLVARQPILPPHQEVSEVRRRLASAPKRLRPKPAVDKLHHGTIRNPKPIVHPIQPTAIVSHRSPGCPIHRGHIAMGGTYTAGLTNMARDLHRPAKPRIHRLILHLLMRSTHDRQIPPRAPARIHQPHRQQPIHRRPVRWHSFGLHPHRQLPSDPQPFEISNHRSHKLRMHPIPVQIFVPQQHLPTRSRRPLPRHQKRSRMPQVQQSRRRRSQPTT